MISTFTAFFDAIVTFNVNDFPADALQPYGMHARHPDDFILDIESLDSMALIEAARDDLRHYANPPLTVDAYLNDLRRAGVPKTADHLGQLKVLLEGDPADQ